MLKINKPFVPKVSRLVGTAGSTNDLAMAALAGPVQPANGAVFRSLSQTGGRGQGGNAWHASPHANLTFSVVAYPGHLPVRRLFALNQVASLSVAYAVRDCLASGPGTRVRVKWPNDVYVGARKIAGVLIQNGLQGYTLAWTVIGIGLNVNEEAFPPELVASATSLRKITRQESDLDVVLDRILKHLQTIYALTRPQHLAELDRRYHELLYRLDETSDFVHVETGREFTGTIRGVTAAGELEVAMLGGRSSAFALREIRLL